ncbi:MAG: MBL fold metallo-hydrolase [Firmicutes bacterium]|nr:MBL fold metallo-hydrolase [Bacillota bacterium]
MIITFIGHSCFKISSKGASAVIDPYADGSIPGLGPVREEADLVLASHGHGDHGAVENVKLSGRKDLPFRVEKVAGCHDDAGGTKRGPNTIHIIDDGEFRLVHAGDQGCPLSDEQIRAIGRCDCLLVPVGGHYTVDADQAFEMAEALGALTVVPMHYRGEGFGFDVIGPVSEFTKHYESFEEGGASLELEKGAKKTAVLTPRNAL